MYKLIIASIAFLAITGCSVNEALTQSAPANLEGIGVGTPRQVVISQIGAPKMTDTDRSGKKQDYFEFQSGMHEGTKARAILYLAADVFTIGLAELIFWPLELTALKEDACTAQATYDGDLKIEAWSVGKKSGGQC